MRILRAVALLGVLGAAWGCARRPAADAAGAGAQGFILSIAAFKNDDLVECDDFSAPSSPGADVPAAADALWKSFQQPKDPKTTVTRLTRPCAEQFRDRPPFGTCAAYTIWKNAPSLRASTFHYSFADVYRSDWAMRECLGMGGVWSSIPRTSEQFLDAQLRFDASNAQKQADNAMRQLERLQRGGTP